MKTYKIDDCGHSITVTETKDGVMVEFLEDGRRLGPGEAWAKLEDVAWYYDIEL